MTKHLGSIFIAVAIFLGLASLRGSGVTIACNTEADRCAVVEKGSVYFMSSGKVFSNVKYR